VLARCSAGIMSLTAAITFIPRDDGLLLVGLAATASLAVARHRRAMERLSFVQNLAKNLAKNLAEQSRKSSRISVMASNTLFPFRLCSSQVLMLGPCCWG
jgi:hypothetical protein